MAEVDLVGCYRGRIICLDIKLAGTDDNAKATQLADVAERTAALGGIGAIAIAVRPGWPENAEIRSLAQALRVELITQAQSVSLFSELLALINAHTALHPAVQAAQALLQSCKASGNSVFSDGRLIEPKRHDDGVINLCTTIEQTAERMGQSWALTQLSGQEFDLAVIKKFFHAPPAANWKAVVDALCSKHCCAVPTDEKYHRVHNTKAWLRIRFAMPHGVKTETALQQIRRVLDKWKVPAQSP